jgi:hypothetical protein
MNELLLRRLFAALSIGASEEKYKFSVDMFSRSTNADLISLIVTLNQFKAWAEVKGLWNTPPKQNAPLLFAEWRKCRLS